MKYAVVGSRRFNDYAKLCQCLAGKEISCIVSGGAKGVDSLAAQYAHEKGINLIEYLPEYDKYGRSARIIRNKQIVDNSDIVVALWDGESRGTKNTIDYAQKTGKQVIVEII